MENGRMTPLDKIAAHDADNGSIFAQFPADGVDLLLVTKMKGVVFADNTNGFQKNPSFFIK